MKNRYLRTIETLDLLPYMPKDDFRVKDQRLLSILINSSLQSRASRDLREERWTTEVLKRVRDLRRKVGRDRRGGSRRRTAVESKIFGSYRHHSSRVCNGNASTSRCGGAILTATANLVCVLAIDDATPNDLALKDRAKSHRARADGRIRWSACLSGKRSTLSHRAAPSRYRNVHVRGVADEWSRSPRYGPVTRDVIYNLPRWDGRPVRHQAGHSLLFPFFLLLLLFHSFSCERPPPQSRFHTISARNKPATRIMSRPSSR